MLCNFCSLSPRITAAILKYFLMVMEFKLLELVMFWASYGHLELKYWFGWLHRDRWSPYEIRYKHPREIHPLWVDNIKKLSQQKIERELMIEKEKEKNPRNVYYTKVDRVPKYKKKMIYKKLSSQKGRIWENKTIVWWKILWCYRESGWPLLSSEERIPASPLGITCLPRAFNKPATTWPRSRLLGGWLSVYY